MHVYDCFRLDFEQFIEKAKGAAKYAHGGRHTGERMGQDRPSTSGQVLSMSTFIRSALTGSTGTEKVAAGGQRSEGGETDSVSPPDRSTCSVKRGRGRVSQRGGRERKKMKIGEVYYPT